MVPLINCGTSFYAGFVIFSVLGFMANEKGVTVDDVAESGPGLVFVVYPEGLTQMPVSPLWSILFFFMLVTLGFSSEFSMSECFFSAVVDEFPDVLRRSPRSNMIFRGVTILIFYLISLPMVTNGGFYLFNLVDNFIGGFPLLFIGFFETTVLMYIYGLGRFSEDIAMMIGKKPNIYFKVTWCFVAPGLLFAIIIFTAIQYEPLTILDMPYPPESLILGWCIVAAPLVCIPGWFFYQLMVDGGWELLKRTSSPVPSWGPANKNDRTGRYMMEDTKEQEVMSSVGYTGLGSRKTSMTSFTGITTISSSANGQMINMQPVNGNQLVQRKPYSAGGPPMGPTTITQPPQTSTPADEPYYSVVDRSSKTVTPPPQYKKEEISAIDDPEEGVNSYTMGGSAATTPRSTSSSPGKHMTTDIDAYSSDGTPKVIRAQINSSGSESGSSAAAGGVTNTAFEEDESKL
jgi:hypothetical protein